MFMIMPAAQTFELAAAVVWSDQYTHRAQRAFCVGSEIKFLLSIGQSVKQNLLTGSCPPGRGVGASLRNAFISVFNKVLGSS